jgi:FAD/FMN-containing dehydrogenase
LFSHSIQKLNDLLASLLESDAPLINTGVLAQNPAQFSSLWALREGVTEAVSKEGKAYKYDISVPLSTFKSVVDQTREHLWSKNLLGDDGVKHVIGYGHVGDGMVVSLLDAYISFIVPLGNLHLNVVAKAYTPEIQAALEPFVYELVGTDGPFSIMFHRINTFPSIPSWVNFCRARHWSHENTCSPLLERSNQCEVDGKDQTGL